MLIEQVNDIGLKAFERGFGDFLNVLRTAVQSGLLSGFRIKFEPKLGSDHDLAAIGRQRLPHQLFVGERTVDFGGVKESDAALDGSPG